MLSLNENIKETAVVAYGVADGIDRCCVSFLPSHCLREVATFDCHLIQVVTLLANSDTPAHWRHSSYNRGACYATIIGTN